MSYPNNNSTAYDKALETLSEEGFDGMNIALQILLNESMKVERNRHVNAGRYERSDDRNGYANGFKDKTVHSRIGDVKLSVPQVRDSTSDFYPASLERGIRSERALRIAVAQMYIEGVSTRKVKNITEKLCGHKVTSMEVSRAAALLDTEQDKWRNRPLQGRYCYLIVDGIYEKVRRDGQVLDSAILIAYGISSDSGKREVLGISVKISEAEVHWRSFFESLVARGLHGLKLITSDAHPGLKAARKAVFPTVPWQRCQFHLQQNAQAHISKRANKEDVARDIRNIFNAPDEQDALRMLDKMIDKYKGSETKLAQWAEDNIAESFAVFALPYKHQKKVRTSNLAERMNKEIRRRTKVVGIFANEKSANRLITAILMETNDQWSNDNVYLDMKK
jgi:putative transposase